jgi:hypothetical protein
MVVELSISNLLVFFDHLALVMMGVEEYLFLVLYHCLWKVIEVVVVEELMNLGFFYSPD